MSARSFFDTNIFLYAGSRAAKDAAKQQRAAQLIQEEPFAISAQVLQEYIANALGKKALGLSEENIDALLAAASEIDVLPVTGELVVRANRLRRRYKIAYWDAAILAAAVELGCHTLYTEDLNHGQVYDGVRVVNPFRNV
jgi:predicted nucleic acid-binding protein